MSKNEIRSQKDGVLLNPEFEEKLNVEELQTLIEDFPETSFARLYNSEIFEQFNFIIKINGNWHFWNDSEQNLDTWDWEEDIKDLEKEFDIEELSEYNEKWELFSTDHLDRGGEELYQEQVLKLNPKNPEYISEEKFENIMEEKRSLENFVKSMIKKYDGTEETLNKILNKIIQRKMKR